MSRAVVMAVMLAVLPPACAKLLGQAPPPPAEEVPPPPPPPILSATAPPAWHPPDPGADAAPGSSSVLPGQPSADLVKARTAADAKDFKKVRSLLEKKVRGGKCAPEESQLVFHACTVLKDKTCADAVKAKHGEDLTE